MAKLIFADRLDGFKLQYSNWQVSSDPSFRAVAFCEDGYIVTHGKVFRTPLGTNDNIYGLSLDYTGGKLKVSAGGYTTAGVDLLGDAADSDYLSKSIVNGVLTYSHKTPAIANRQNVTSKGTTTTTQINTSASIVGGITYDDYGHVTAGYSRELVLNHVKSSTSTTDTIYYLLGHSDSTTDYTGQTYKNSNIYFQNGNLYVGGLYVNNSSIQDLISASQALYFRGTVDSTYETNNSELKQFVALPTSGVNIGDLYVVGSGGYTIGSGLNAEVCEAGDMIIATSVTTSGGTQIIIWSAIQRNLANTITEINIGGTTSGNKLAVFKDTDGKLYVTQTDTNTWRDITVGGTSFLGTGTDSGALNFIQGTGITIVGSNEGLTITNSSPLSAASSLNLKYYVNPTDAEATSMIEYNPSSTAKTLAFKAGNNVSLLYENNVLTIASSYVDTTYQILVNSNANATSSMTPIDLNNSSTDLPRDPYVILHPSSGNNTAFKLIGGGSTSITYNGTEITISSLNSWRTVSAYTYNSSNNTSPGHSEILTNETIGTADLDFGEEFLWDATSQNNANGQLHLGWAEVTSTLDDQGNITSTSVSYHI